ncbi:DUF6193 family natural product biosynthesis protein [Streptomyces sp. NPDC090306]|uniref:DUF6193 family natural product biosynthesis protein n=1 Tax=Streptomyces sp. NPDC090306 TaxID=3365961 RepID=UPI003802A09D
MNADGTIRADGPGPVPPSSGFPEPATARGLADGGGDGTAADHAVGTAVEARWRQLVLVWQWERERQEANAPDTPYPGIVALLEAARADPELRRLYPFTSHFTVSFSSTVKFPYVVRAPSVTPLPDGTYRVHRREVPAMLGVVGSAAEAVALVRAHLPEGLGPAVADATALDG